MLGFFKFRRLYLAQLLLQETECLSSKLLQVQLYSKNLSRAFEEASFVIYAGAA
jgi:hypothetical protein